MIWLRALLLTGLVDLVSTLVGKVIAALGASVITYTGVSFTLDFLKSQVISRVSVLPPEVIGMLGVLKVGTCISILFSALVARLALKGLSSAGGGTVKKWVTK